MNPFITRSFQTTLSTAMLSAIMLFTMGCGIQIKSLKSSASVNSVSTIDPRVVFRFFDEDFVAGGYAYNYPDASKVYIPEDSGKNGEVAVMFDLEAADYSGGSVCLYNLLYDMVPYYNTGALEFWIKGDSGDEIASAALVDDENADGKKTVIRLPINNYGGIGKEWRHVSIPLRDFGKKGVFWDAKKRVELPELFQWNAVAEFRIEIKKGDNPRFKVLVDDIFVLRDAVAPSTEVPKELWEDRPEIIAPVPVAQKPAVNVLKSLYTENATGGLYVFGGKTSSVVKRTTDNNSVLVCYLDNDDYSGVTLMLGAGNNIDMTPLRAMKGAGLGFWIKANTPVKSLFVGLMDVENADLKIQSKLLAGDFGQVDTTWKYFMIPLRRFIDKGKYWDANKKAELMGDMNWKNISEIRFSGNKGETKMAPGEPIKIFLDNIEIIEQIPGYVDPEEYWAQFKSDKPDVLLHDFEAKDRGWEINKGEKSEIKIDYVPAMRPQDGLSSMKTTYKLIDYCDVLNDYGKNNTISVDKRDWTKHWGITFDLYSDRAYQPVSVQIDDAGKEVFIASVGAEKGWSTILVPFKAFSKFAYYQPPDAVQNGHLDLGGVNKLDFKPAGDGSSGSYIIDNVKLTNEREIKLAPVAEKTDVIINGDLKKIVTKTINDGIFGINAALWDGDMLAQSTIDAVKMVNHKILRYPGGLRADDDHWEDVLKKKDFMVDIDEFLGFCKQTLTEPMITVNFGSGTPEEAARWVKYCNIDKKANVKYWEIGNEIYGNWHPHVTTGPDYGARAAAFIKAMKAVDPSILVTVVWVLEGAWNKEVFEYTKDIADGVNVHHYSQHAGEENDAGLLSAPQSVEQILGNVRAQIASYGTAGKKYEIWLTEWNSVDFKPGPQTLSIINGLFTADYLGVLAKTNIEQASYWDIHNDITEQGGDYGYLSRTGAPDGDNAPRPSYWAFYMAQQVLRGSLVTATSNNDKVSVYATSNGAKKSMLIINKYPRTSAVIALGIDGFSGKGTLNQLTKDSGRTGPSTQAVTVVKGQKFTLPPYSITTIEIQ